MYGKPPFFHHAMRWQWYVNPFEPGNRQTWADSCDRSISKTISLEGRNRYWRRCEVYRKWLFERVFDAESKTVVTIMVFPIEAGKPNYREVELP